MPVFKIQNRKLIIHFEITAAHVFAASLVLALMLYLGWEIYWYQQRGLYFIKWHTHIMFAAFAASFVVAPFLFWSFKTRTEKSKKYLLAASSVALMIILLETFFTVTGSRKVYSEIRNGFYQSPYAHDLLNYYHIKTPYDSGYLKTPEYSYLRKYNSLGYSDREWKKEKTPGTTRIVTLGDSFTEGDGAPADSCYPVMLNSILKSANGSFEVLNAGLCGSDPVISYVNLRDRLVEFQPDWVVIAISDNDIIYDFGLRGGFERFTSRKTVDYKKAPSWEPLYAISYFSRPFFHAFGYDISEPVSLEKKEEHAKEVLQTFEALTDSLNRLAEENGLKVLFVKMPLIRDLTEGSPYDFDYSPIEAMISESANLFIADLFPCYLEKSKEEANGLRAYYWVIDAHHNSRGYKMMAECVANALLPLMSEKTNFELNDSGYQNSELIDQSIEKARIKSNR